MLQLCSGDQGLQKYWSDRRSSFPRAVGGHASLGEAASGKAPPAPWGETRVLGSACSDGALTERSRAGAETEEEHLASSFSSLLGQDPVAGRW